MTGNALSPEIPVHVRRRSADVGGLYRATANQGGHGWVGYEKPSEVEEGPPQTRFAELLSDMYTQTLNAVNEHNVAYSPQTDLTTDTRSRLVHSLDSWNFEPHKLPEEEVLWCTLILFEALFRIEGMQETVGVSLREISSFLRHLRQIYRWENSYHNFEHALDVLQACQSFLRSAGMVPPLSILLGHPDRMWKLDKTHDDGSLITSLGLRELFVVYVAAIGHDVGHPGFTNVFMNNAQTPLSVVYDGQSALEQMHCQLLLRVMRHHGMGHLLDDPEHGVRMRKFLWRTVLATDMSVHMDFMERLKAYVAGEQGALCLRQILAAQAIMKCSDISNPARPPSVSQYWASALMREWNSQAVLEKHFHLAITVPDSDDALREARSQVFFMNTFAKPLLDLTVRAIPEMMPYSQQCSSNLRLWETRLAELLNDDDSDDIPSNVEIAEGDGPPPPTASSASFRQPEDFASAFPLTLPPSFHACQDEVATAAPAWSTIPRSAFSSSSGSPPSSTASSDSGIGDPLGNVQDPYTHALDSVSPGPSSPADSINSSIFSPHSDFSNAHTHPPSSSGSSVSNVNLSSITANSNTNNDNAVIRAAFEVGVRKKKSFHRHSWTPSYLHSTAPKPPLPPSNLGQSSTLGSKVELHLSSGGEAAIRTTKCMCNGTSRTPVSTIVVAKPIVKTRREGSSS